MEENFIQIILGTLIPVLFAFMGDMLSRFLKKNKKSEAPSPTEKLNVALNTLKRTASEMDSVITDVTSDIRRRQEALAELQTRSDAMTAQEAALQKKIDHLSNIPVEVARYFQEINAANLVELDKKSSRRDITFFILGVVVSVITAVILKAFGI